MTTPKWEKKRSGKTAILSYVCKPTKNEMAVVKFHIYSIRCIGSILLDDKKLVKLNGGSNVVHIAETLNTEVGLDKAKEKALKLLEATRLLLGALEEKANEKKELPQKGGSGKMGQGKT